jgi:anti-sigma factor RsiW
MSDWTPLAPKSGEHPSEEAAREARHQVLIDLLAAYADRELPPETTSQIEAHLVGCARCRRELAVNEAVRRGLGDEPFVGAPPALRDRIIAAVAAAPAVQETPAPETSRGLRWLSRRWVLLALASVVIVGAAIASTTVFGARAASVSLGQLAVSPANVPLLREALADYRRVTAGDLPGRARDLEAVRSAVPFPIEPLRAPGVRLLAAWTTELVDEPAAVLAYRWDDRIIVEYLVAEGRFFQYPAIRSAVSDHRVLTAADGAQGIVGWPTDAAGALVIGDVSPQRLARILAPQPLARSVDSGAQ